MKRAGGKPSGAPKHARPARGGRTAILVSSLRGGGAERQMLLLASELARRGRDVELVLVNRKSSAYSPPKALTVFDLGAARISAAAPALIRYLQARRPAVMYSAETPVNVLALLGREIAHQPERLIVSERNHLSSLARHAPKLADRMRPWLVRTLYPRADAVVTVSKDVAADLIRVARLPAEKVRAIYNMFDVDEIMRQARNRPERRGPQRRDIPGIISVGRLVPQKDHATLLKAFAILRRRRACRLTILGEGPERPLLERMARDLGIESQISMPGFVPNPYSHMAAASVFALSSAWEGLPGALIEAMACGVPAVATDCPGGTAEILEGGRLGELVQVGDAAALAAAMERALNHPISKTRLQHRARDFSIERLLPQFEEILHPAAWEGKKRA